MEKIINQSVVSEILTGNKTSIRADYKKKDGKYSNRMEFIREAKKLIKKGLKSEDLADELRTKIKGI